MSSMHGFEHPVMIYFHPLVTVTKILEVGDLPEGQETVAVGTIYKDMKLKPSIMDEYTKDR